MIKEEIAPGIVVYSEVIANGETLYQDIEEGMASANIQWQQASVKETDEPKVNTNTRDTHTLGVNYLGRVDDSTPASMSEFLLLIL